MHSFAFRKTMSEGSKNISCQKVETFAIDKCDDYNRRLVPKYKNGDNYETLHSRPTLFWR